MDWQDWFIEEVTDSFGFLKSGFGLQLSDKFQEQMGAGVTYRDGADSIALDIAYCPMRLELDVTINYQLGGNKGTTSLWELASVGGNERSASLPCGVYEARESREAIRMLVLHMASGLKIHLPKLLSDTVRTVAAIEASRQAYRDEQTRNEADARFHEKDWPAYLALMSEIAGRATPLDEKRLAYARTQHQKSKRTLRP